MRDRQTLIDQLTSRLSGISNRAPKEPSIAEMIEMMHCSQQEYYNFYDAVYTAGMNAGYEMGFKEGMQKLDTDEFKNGN